MNNVINQIPYLRTSRNFPQDAPQLSVELSKSYIDIANAINARTIGIFPTSRPAITGESWYLTQNLRQQSFRQVYTFGVIPNPPNSFQIPHNINFRDVSTFTVIRGIFTDGTVYHPIPYVDPRTGVVTFDVGIFVDSTNINITMGAARTNIQSGLVILEWLSKP